MVDVEEQVSITKKAYNILYSEDKIYHMYLKVSMFLMAKK